MDETVALVAARLRRYFMDSEATEMATEIVGGVRKQWEQEQLKAMSELRAKWEAKPAEDFDDRTYRGGGLDALNEAMSPQIVIKP